MGVGTSGVLLSLLLTHTGNALKRGLSLVTALKAGLETMMKYAGSRPGERSMLDALVPAIEALEQQESLQVVAQRARNGATKSSEMVAKVGRAANVPPEVYLKANGVNGVNDSGAEAVAVIFECLAE